MTKICYIAAYYTLQKDLHKNVQLEPDSFDYIKDYYNSIVKNGLQSVILHDDCSDAFVEKYQTDKIRFVKTEHRFTMQPHDSRFIEYNNYLFNHEEVEYACLTDISDVVVIKNCDIIANKKLFIGVENENIYDNTWFGEYLHYIKDTCSINMADKQQFKFKTLLNCGIVAGHRSVLMKFLYYCNRLITMLYKYELTRPVDMFVVNYVTYFYFIDVLNTEKFVTMFGHNEYDSACYLKHK